VSVVVARVTDLLAPFAFIGRATASAFAHPSPTSVVALLGRLLVSSLPVVFVVAFFAGAMLTVQAANSLTLIGGGPMSGFLVGLGGVREVFPLLAVASVAARSGAEFASELGTMRVTQQVDALEVMGVDPLRLLVAPRVLAAAIGTPFCVLVAVIAGLFGAWIIGTFQLGIDRGSMWYALLSGVSWFDLVVGIGKGVLLGWLVGAVSTREGWVASGGPRGVGLATNRAVVRTMIAVCLTSLLITYLVYGRSVAG
jgi:phospholipid/cholesterol/gamma-HCH transport system permease protein